MNDIYKLLEQIRDKLISDCERGWDRYTDNYIVPRDKYTCEEQMEIGDHEAWRLLQEVIRHLYAVEEKETGSDISSETRQFTLD